MNESVLNGDKLVAVMTAKNEREAKLGELVFVSNGRIVINVRSEYDISLERCDTHAKIVAWVLHLSEKTWMTQEILTTFIRLAMSENSLEAPLPGA